MALPTKQLIYCLMLAVQELNRQMAANLEVVQQNVASMHRLIESMDKNTAVHTEIVRRQRMDDEENPWRESL